MARNERAVLAAARAMEEENARMTMRGSGRASAYGGRMTGAGATPSMGLSQFRGGAAMCMAEAPKKKGGRRRRSPSPEMEDEEDMEGGFLGVLSSAARAAASRATAAAATRAAATRAAQQAAQQAARTRAAQAAAMRQPLLTSAQRAAAQVSRPTPVNIPKGSVITPSGTRVATAGRPTATPATPAQVAQEKAAAAISGNIARGKQRLAQTAAQQQRAANLQRVGQATSTGLSRLGTVANVAIPAYMLADYLRQKQEQEGLDAGYFDDFETGVLPEPAPLPMSPVDTSVPQPEGIPAPEMEEEMMMEDGRDEIEVKAEQMGLSRAEYMNWLRTGNLPVQRGRRRVGAGELKITHGGARRQRPSKATGRRAERAEIVRKVMRERGVKLGEASRIVKQEGLF